MDITGWLRGLGLERYEEAFRENAIDAEVLPELTDADLERLGVLLGHRKRLLKAITELRAGAIAIATLMRASKTKLNFMTRLLKVFSRERWWARRVFTNSTALSSLFVIIF